MCNKGQKYATIIRTKLPVFTAKYNAVIKIINEINPVKYFNTGTFDMALVNIPSKHIFIL